MTPPPAAEITGLTRGFGGPPVLDRLSLAIGSGEFAALLGRSGTGKSTLLRTLAGLDPAPAGSLRAPAARAVVFQEPRLFPWRRVWHNVALGLRRADAKARALAALAEVGLAHRAQAWPLTLSGGEAQRAAVARALVREPELLLLDEPFSAVDALTRLRMQTLLLTLWQKHRPAVLLVTHDVDEALLLADRVLVLDSGRITRDHTIGTPRPRQPTHPDHARLRASLLASLGVGQGGSAPLDPPPRAEPLEPLRVGGG